MFCFFKDLEIAQKWQVFGCCTKHIYSETAAKGQQKHILICFQDPWISARYYVMPLEGATKGDNYKASPEIGWEDSSKQQGRVNFFASQDT